MLIFSSGNTAAELSEGQIEILLTGFLHATMELIMGSLQRLDEPEKPHPPSATTRLSTAGITSPTSLEETAMSDYQQDLSSSPQENVCWITIGWGGGGGGEGDNWAVIEIIK